LSMSATHAVSNEGSDSPVSVRVLVVGRTALHGVDSALRLDRSIELVRARTPMAALGELADPIDTSSPVDVAVVVAPDAVPDDRSAAFAQAARRLSDRVRLLALTSITPEGFDGRLVLDDPSRPLTMQVRVPRVEAVAASLVEVDVNEAPRVSAPGVKPVISAANLPETAPVIAMATGHDAVEAVLGGIAQRLDVTDARFVHASAEFNPDGGISVPVNFGGRTLGQLVIFGATGTGAPVLKVIAAEAEHLGAWVALREQQEQLRQAAFTDELTGAWNRRYFNRFLGAAIGQATGARHTVTLLAFDVDNFKSYNDRFGHAAGDEILVQVVRLLNACIRSTDRVCRVGGDEFVVIFHDPEGPRGPAGTPTSPRSIGDIVRRFQKQVLEHRFPKLGEMAPGMLTLSGGMATFPWDGRTVQQLLDRADELALQSKQQGKNHITLGPGAEKACRLD